MTDIAESGTKRDLRRRAKKREDSEKLRQDIHDARRYLFEGHAFTNARLTSRLDAHSLNPIQVGQPVLRRFDACTQLMLL